MKRTRVVLLTLFLLCLVTLTRAQVGLTLREEARKRGTAWRITISDRFFLATFDQLVSGSDLIIRGRVVDERTRLSPDDERVLTDYTLEVLEVLKDAQVALKVGDKLVVSKWGGNVLVEGRPVRADTPQFPPVLWVQPHIFFIARWTAKAAPGEYGFAGGQLGAFPLEHGKVVCKTQEMLQHPVTMQSCGKTEQEFLQIVKERIL